MSTAVHTSLNPEEFVEKTTIKKLKKPQVKKMRVGALLKKARLDKNQKINHIVKILNIREEYLRALENDDTEKLPKNIYSIGFLRAYSQFLGLNASEMVSLFREQNTMISPCISIPTCPEPIEEECEDDTEETRHPTSKAMIWSCVGVIAFFGALYSREYWHERWDSFLTSMPALWE